MVERRPLIHRLVAAAVLVCCAGLAGNAYAQSSTPPLTVEEIQYCMCQEQYIDALRPELEARQAIRNERESALKLLEAEIASLQSSADPNNVAQQEALKNKIYQANQLRDQIRRDFGVVHNSTVREFNAAVRSYNENCANRRMIAVDVAAATETLSCPPVPLP